MLAELPVVVRPSLDRRPPTPRTDAVVTQRVVAEIDALIDPLTSTGTPPLLLRPGTVREELLQIDLPELSVRLVDFSCPVAMQGASAADRIEILTVVEQTARGHVNGHALTPGVLYVFGESSDVIATSAEGSTYALLSFTRAALETAASELGVELGLPGPGELRQARPAEWTRMQRLLQRVQRTFRSAPESASLEFASSVRGPLLADIVDSLADDQPRVAPSGEGRYNAVRIVLACERFAATARYQCVTLADLAIASGVSERSVRNAFAGCFGMSPTAYLRVAALHRVRRHLLLGSWSADTVSRTASDFGFWHLSRFASYYRTLFGEVPSNTVAQSTRVAAVAESG